MEADIPEEQDAPSLPNPAALVHHLVKESSSCTASANMMEMDHLVNHPLQHAAAYTGRLKFE